MSEIEDVLGIHAVPLNWPVGSGREFRGVYDRIGEQLQLFEGGHHGTQKVEQIAIEGALDTTPVREAMGSAADEVRDALALLDGAGEPFDLDQVRAGEQTPLFFGSALTNFGVLPFLERFLDIAPSPGPRSSDVGLIEPVGSEFAGFIFKIQANMDPDHRDRVAFLRVSSGRFSTDESTIHTRTGKKVRLSKSSLVQARGREALDVAYPGDVVGLFDPGIYQIGDTLCDTGAFNFAGIPSFSPEHFVRVEVAEILNRKSLSKGLTQLAQEGAVQLFSEPGSGTAVPILGAVGPLQFDVMQHRMATEYKVDLKFTPLPYCIARWLGPDTDTGIFRFSEAKLLEDRSGRAVVLAKSPWYLDRLQEKHPQLILNPTAVSS
jgi:peptide chain release factor 3